MKVHLKLPITWKDQTVNIFSFAKGRWNISFVITRDYLQPKEDLKDYMHRQIAQLDKELKNYEQLRTETIDIDHKPAEILEFIWKHSDGMMRHLQATAVVERDKVLTFTLTVLDKRMDEDIEEIFFSTI